MADRRPNAKPRAPRAPVVTLLTDFGTADGYAAAMKGVILALALRARVVDLTQEVPPHDVRAGAWALRQAWPYFPRGTIHVAVVDPGVGTARRGLLVAADGQLFLGPDNGLFAWVLREARRAVTRQLRADVHRPGAVSATFHGRDIFAHAAGLLAAGRLRPAAAGPVIRDPVLPAWSAPARRGEALCGEVIHVDRFGNLVTNLPAAAAEPGAVLVAGGRRLPVRRTYGDVPRGAALALAGSSGFLEIAVREGRADRRLRLGRGSPVRLAPPGAAQPQPNPEDKGRWKHGEERRTATGLEETRRRKGPSPSFPSRFPN